jgi:D-3-phosphoglycerate dehydrogenase
MFRVGVTRDFLKADGTLGFGDIGLDLFAGTGVSWEYLPSLDAEILPEQARDYDGLLILAPRVGSRTLEGTEHLKVAARFGVGYDNVDVPACTRVGSPADDHPRRGAPARGDRRPDVPAGAQP